MSKDQARDTGMALLLILLGLGLYKSNMIYFKVGLIALLINMTVPEVYKPLAKVWFLFSEKLNFVMTKVIMTIIFTLVVVPFAIIFKIRGKDSLRIKKFKKDTVSVLDERNHKYTEKDLLKPF
jgi:uncharacterized membrane protein YedE/YeeE